MSSELNFQISADSDMFANGILQRICLKPTCQYIWQKRALIIFVTLTVFPGCKLWPHVIPLEWSFLPRSVNDHETLYETFHTFQDAMDRANVTYVMTMGTLIGSFRHHGIIPWDHDIDVMANSSDKAKVLQALRNSPGSNFYLEQRWEDLWRFYKNYYIYAGFVDIWFYEENSTHLLLGKYIFDKRHLFPLTRRPFGDRMSWAACDPIRIPRRHPGQRVRLCEWEVVEERSGRSMLRDQAHVPHGSKGSRVWRPGDCGRDAHVSRDGFQEGPSQIRNRLFEFQSNGKIFFEGFQLRAVCRYCSLITKECNVHYMDWRKGTSHYEVTVKKILSHWVIESSRERVTIIIYVYNIHIILLSTTVVSFFYEYKTCPAPKTISPCVECRERNPCWC